MTANNTGFSLIVLQPTNLTLVSPGCPVKAVTGLVLSEALGAVCHPWLVVPSSVLHHHTVSPCLPLRRTLVITFRAHLDNPEPSSSLSILNVTTSAKQSLCRMLEHSQVPGIRSKVSLGPLFGSHRGLSKAYSFIDFIKCQPIFERPLLDVVRVCAGMCVFLSKKKEGWNV